MIQFINDISTNRLRTAFNNDVAEFYSTVSLQSLYCDINAPGFSVRLYPNPQGRYCFNFRPFVAALINTRNFEDTLQPAIIANNPASFIYNFTAGTYLALDVEISITLEANVHDTATYSLAWFAGVEQPADYTAFLTTGTYLLTPFRKDTVNHYYLKYWKGYPFDMALYHPAPSLTLKNDTTLLSQEFDMPGIISRIVLSDGRTDETLEGLLPLSEGHNSIRIMNGTSPSADDKFLTLHKIPYRCGVYVKWLNKYGGYSYWLFEDTYAIDRSTRALGELARDNANLEHTFGRTIQTGRETQDTIKVVAELLTDDERRIVEGILDSPKIYLFTGRPYAKNSQRDWIEVSLKTSGARIKNAKQPLTNFTLDLELPQRYTQVL